MVTCWVAQVRSADHFESYTMNVMTFRHRLAFAVAIFLGFSCFVRSAMQAATPEMRLRVLFLGDDGLHKPADRFAEVQPVLSGRSIRPEHPLMTGLSPIESWDETYVHTKHNTDRIVLSERRDASGAEPYTWVREHGKGRVFYTAWGHDSRTWTNAEFQTLLASGVRWASANSTSRLKAKTGLRPFEYMEAAAPLPNYVPNARWGTQADPIRTMQKPLTPEESMKHLVLLPEFSTSLYAAEPDIAKAIWMTWDEQGRLWIAETFDYPNSMRPIGQGRDRIKICEDSDGDGKADKFTVFAENLSVPTSFVFASGGVIVVHSGKTEFLKDTNGDDRADVRRDLFTGWGTRDTHAGPSNLRNGFDNWIWGTVGYSGFDGKVGGRDLRFGQGIFRFKPDGTALEFIRSSNNNTWGLGFSEEGIVFGSTANGNASMYLAVPNRYYETVNGWSAARLETIADSQSFYPITSNVRQVDWHDRYTAGAGSALYTARSFPKEFWNRVQFVAEPTGHLLGKFHLIAHGSDFVAHNGRNFLASDDEWTSPICAEVGPDGALWVIDWYNYIVQHNPTPIGFQTGKGNAYDTPLRDQTHGRIYRVAYTGVQGSQAGNAPNLRSAPPSQMVRALKHPNMFWRTTAQRLLVDRGQLDVVPRLRELAGDKSVDAIGLNPGAIHALWTLSGLGALDGGNAEANETAYAALQHPSAGVRRAALMVVPRNSGSLTALLRGGLLEDDDAQVRLAALLAVSEMPPLEGAGSAVFAMFQEKRNAGDRWIPDAVTAAAARNDAAFLMAAIANYKPDPIDDAKLVPAPGSELAGAVGRVIRLVTAHYAQRGPVDSIVSTLSGLDKAPESLAIPILEGLVFGWPQGKAPALDDGEKRELMRLMGAVPELARDRLLGLAQRWERTDIFGDSISRIIGSLRTQIAGAKLSDELRVSAGKRLLFLEDSPETAKLILKQITPLTLPSLAVGLVGALTESREALTGKTLTENWDQFTPTVRRAAIGTLMRRAEWAAALLDAIENGNVVPKDLAVEQWAQLKANPNRTISGRANRLAEAGAAVSADLQETVAKLLPLAKEPGNADRGVEVFTANCAVCHTFNGNGGKVGPDLSGIGARDRAEILTDILDPNRSVEANFRLWNVTTEGGETFSGLLETETQTSVEILDTTGQKHIIQRKEIAAMAGSQLSVMPNGFETLPPDDLRALLTYLTQPHP